MGVSVDPHKAPSVPHGHGMAGPRLMPLLDSLPGSLQRGQDALRLVQAITLALQEGAAITTYLFLLGEPPRSQDVQLALCPVDAGVE